ncbi:MAG: restriction endonuclease subunit S [Selenomonas ruminantium]|nr:restriction endonuclease subunit S [Selenomonas ruminantium]
MPEFLFIFLNRGEFDRYARWDSWGSATEFFNWENMCAVHITLPAIAIQQKVVAVYNEMKENLVAYESGLEDLKLTCDGFIEDLRRNNVSKEIGEYIVRHDVRNSDNKISNVMGISVLKQFRKPSSKVDVNNLSNYKVVKPRQVAFVQTTNNEKVFAYAFNDSNEDIVVSSVDEVFSIDEERLYPEYLCMWFNRTEFDRYARFNSWGTARETFVWSDLIKVKIPIPDIRVQKSIADIYSCYIERKRIAEELREQLKNICPILLRGALMATD